MRNWREKGERTTPKNNLTHIREDKTGGETMVEEIHPVRKDDPGYRSDHNDDRQRNSDPI